MKRILITGAAGFLGSHLCDRFIKEGYFVIGMDNLITGDLKNIEHLFKDKNFEFYHHDITKFVHVPGELVLFEIIILYPFLIFRLIQGWKGFFNDHVCRIQILIEQKS